MHSNLKERAKKLKTDVPALFLALKDKDTPILAKVFAAFTVLYALSPIDLIPDFIPVLGYLDDVILLPGMIALTIKLIPNDVIDRNRKQAEGMWADGNPWKSRAKEPGRNKAQSAANLGLSRLFMKEK